MRIRHFFILLSFLYSIAISAQPSRIDVKTVKKIEKFLKKYKVNNKDKSQTPVILDYKVDNSKRTVRITVDETFAMQEFSAKTTRKIYEGISKRLDKRYRNHKITIISNGLSIDNLAPNIKSEAGKRPSGRINIDYKKNPWKKKI